MPPDQPENLVLQLLRDMRENLATKADIVTLQSDMHSLRADIASDLHVLDAKIDTKIDTLQKDLSERIAGLRRAVMEYHSSAIGHGILISEFEERLRKVEQRLGLDEAH